MSALPPKADIAERDWDVRFVPKADIRETCANWPPVMKRAETITKEAIVQMSARFKGNCPQTMIR
jgi:hypothetical protein